MCGHRSQTLGLACTWRKQTNKSCLVNKYVPIESYTEYEAIGHCEHQCFTMAALNMDSFSQSRVSIKCIDWNWLVNRERESTGHFPHPAALIPKSDEPIDNNRIVFAEELFTIEIAIRALAHCYTDSAKRNIYGISSSSIWSSDCVCPAQPERNWNGLNQNWSHKLCIQSRQTIELIFDSCQLACDENEMEN